ncbi:unnamed protein product [Kuraishia capsulata CBS 1993]|uniref:Adenylate cyclase n=1 Tax=Kuraishia capsulata CBS 1993 TaxID=1382522 RepID=W6MUJ6_9ASCO|nr:uncharacterized protein KUCA_T00001655001 [Kuraishia capsulata CBS 1993]CDK25685.1 unnamed protein product [Kuraishia capsulata CBS 1993]
MPQFPSFGRNALSSLLKGQDEETAISPTASRANSIASQPITSTTSNAKPQFKQKYDDRGSVVSTPASDVKTPLVTRKSSVMQSPLNSRAGSHQSSSSNSSYERQNSHITKGSIGGVPKDYHGFHAAKSSKIVPPLSHPIKPKRRILNRLIHGRRESEPVKSSLAASQPTTRRSDPNPTSSTDPSQGNSVSSTSPVAATDVIPESSASPVPDIQESQQVVDEGLSTPRRPTAGDLNQGFLTRNGSTFIDLQADEDDLSGIVNRNVSTASSLNVAGNADTKKANWAAPESWKVKGQDVAVEEPHNEASEPDAAELSDASSESSASSIPPSEANVTQNAVPEQNEPADNGSVAEKAIPMSTKSSFANGSEAHHHHHHHHALKEVSGSARSSLRLSKGDKITVISCTIDTTVKEVMDSLRRKRFLKAGDDYMILLKSGGLIRVLTIDEKPLRIQRHLLLMYGYTDRDNIDYIERTDLSFLVKFVVQEKEVETISLEKRRQIDAHHVNLQNWNLQDIPNFLFAEPIISLDVSENPSVELTKEFLHDCRHLEELHFTRNGIGRFPTTIIHAPKLKDLHLEVNNFRYIPTEIAMLQTLTYLNLACNRLQTLPGSVSELVNLKVINISSNRFKVFPEPVTMIPGLTELDLSYNSLSSIPSSLGMMSNLKVLKLGGNNLDKELSPCFSKLKNLVYLDVRFNYLRSISSSGTLPGLKTLRATGNNVSEFDVSAEKLEVIELNINPVTSLNCLKVLPALKILDLSKAKLTTLTFLDKVPNLEKLILDNNHLASLPDEMARLSRLQYLSAFKNNLSSFFSGCGGLKYLRYLDLHLNNISSLDSEIWDLPSLTTLNVSSNLLEDFPEPRESINTRSSGLARIPSIAIQQKGNAGDHSRRRGSEPASSQDWEPSKIGLISSLRDLSIADNKLNDNVVPIVSLFKNLKSLNLSYNDLFDIPSGYLCNLKSLEGLFLSGNYLSTLPVEDLDSFTRLKTLHLNGNRFHTLPSELSKIENMTALDVGSNNLKYNIGNLPYDWNWHYNPKLKFLNFSGNKRLEIKHQHARGEDSTDNLDSFLSLKDIRILGLMDVTFTTDSLPDQGANTRVRTTASQIGKFGYGISDTLAEDESLSIRDVVVERFRGNGDETLITIYDGKNHTDTKSGHKISKIIQETFDFHFAKELESVGTKEGHVVKSVEDALRSAYLTMNTEINVLINKGESSTFTSAAAHRTTTTDELTMEEDALTGCCATILYIKGDTLYTANIGDTMGILAKSNGEYTCLTTKHEPYAPEEYERIRMSGGYVTTDGFLDGVVDVSRAVGFYKLIPHINASPSICVHKLKPGDEMVAIATNELWKKIPFDLAVDIIRQERQNPGVAAEKLRDFAISYGSTDKLSAVVLSLKQFSAKTKPHEKSSQAFDSGLRKLEEEIEPPTGELAMVFTDIKNSTLLWDTYPVAMRSAIKVHNSIMRRQLRIVGGYEVKTEGDAFMVSFPTVTSALMWCFSVQSNLLTTPEWPAEILASEHGSEIKDKHGNVVFRGLSVRMGINWGSPVSERDIVTKRMDYFGPMVNRASRVSAVADGGQISLSSDFFDEFHRVKKLHEEVKAGKSIQEAYGSLSQGQILEAQMEQLEQIKWVEFPIGEKKLKGLETPENICLIFPKQLESRFEMQGMLPNSSERKKHTSTRLSSYGFNDATAFRMRNLSIRLEKLCSALCADNEVDVEPNTTMQLSTLAANDFLSEAQEAELLYFMDHLVTRIENCVGNLSLRKEISLIRGDEPGLSTINVPELLEEITTLLRAAGSLKLTSSTQP